MSRPLEDFANAILALYDERDAQRFVDAMSSDEPRRALMRLANRDVVRDHGLVAAAALLRSAAAALDAA